MELIRRRLPAFAQCFAIERIPADQGRSVYEICARDGKVVLRGDNGVSTAMAFYHYLKEFCKVNWSWCGNRDFTVEEIVLPDAPLRRVVEQKHRVYMNYCTLGYSAAFWDWERWEKEIDFMAMNGINMPLTVIGTEAVWYETLQEFGFTKDEARAFLSGPAYWPWQLMTNIEGFLPPPDDSYIYERLRLGKKILSRQLELGMTPIGQGFSGHVPKLFQEKFPKARITKTGKWCGFPETCQLDPLDPLFQRLGSALLKKQKELLGGYTYLASDPFHENKPSSRRPGYLKKVGRAIDGLYRAYAPDSVWVMQSWSLRRPIVKAVPKDRLLILHINGQDAPAGKRRFWGYPYVTGNLMNFGGKNSLHGDIAALAGNPYHRQKPANPALCGTGLFMEGINQNPLYYELLFDTLTQSGEIPLDGWLEDYARRRYHSTEPCLLRALKLLRESCYSTYKNAEESGSIVCARPALHVTRAAPNDTIGVRYDNTVLLSAAAALLESGSPPTDGYLFDVCDILRQAISNYAFSLYQKLSESFDTYKKEEFLSLKQEFLQLILDLDRLCSTRGELTLEHWAGTAVRRGRTEEEREFYRKNALMLVTLWGPPEEPLIFDYAWKEWGGLIKNYYYERWSLFLNDLTDRFDTAPRKEEESLPMAYGRPSMEAGPLQQRLAKLERQFVTSYQPEAPPHGDTLTVARELYGVYAPKITAVASEVTVQKNTNLNFWRK